ncbi:winged helix-turn-helix domain-containing protein [Desulfurococcus amylolyticus]|uniref:Putative transcriptional regulator n=1 Tax=Desulfurococcus amylolyticus DSM 16532 TaxID=768672 RepID=I3XS67_DESAM|nr:winged helix-turn-helix domain-containing protein [Desulfurococcus amylolyticus]AFL66791.1 putative transcriptional regulator [Desulfurococcus amylolyticus DSM 16532]
MNKQHRSSIDIVESILEHLSREGKSIKTHMLYASNLNTIVFEKYLLMLIRKGFILKIGDASEYTLSNKGAILLERIRNLKRMLLEDDKGDRLVDRKLNTVIERNLGGMVKVHGYQGYKGASGAHYYVYTIKHSSGSYIVDAVLSSKPDILVEACIRMLVISTDIGVPAILVVKGSSEKHVVMDLLGKIDASKIMVLSI